MLVILEEGIQLLIQLLSSSTYGTEFSILKKNVEKPCSLLASYDLWL